MTDSLHVQIEFTRGIYAGLDYARGPETVMSPVRLIYALIRAAHAVNGDDPQAGKIAFGVVDALGRAKPPAIVWPEGVTSSFALFRPKHLVGNDANESTDVGRVRFVDASPICVLSWRWDDDFSSFADRELVRQNLQCLRRLLALVERIGDAESTTRVSLTDAPPVNGVTYRPLSSYAIPVRATRLRWATPNIRAECEAIYQRERNLHYTLPSQPVAYVRRAARVVPPVRDSSGEWGRIRLAIDPGVSLSHFERITNLVHRALTACYPNPLVHGHESRIGGVGWADHIMLLPVIEQQKVTAVDLVIPQQASQADVDAICDAIVTRLVPRGLHMTRSVSHAVTMRVLQVEQTAAEWWVTQTPYVTDSRVRNPTRAVKRGGNRGKQIAAAVIESCKYVGMPAPAQLSFGFDQIVEDSLCAPDFVRVRRRTRNLSKRPHAFLHLALRWNSPIVAAPALGACRFFGWGKLLPLHAVSGD